jgi:hypothetical protein
MATNQLRKSFPVFGVSQEAGGYLDLAGGLDKPGSNPADLSNASGRISFVSL